MICLLAFSSAKNISTPLEAISKIPIKNSSFFFRLSFSNEYPDTVVNNSKLIFFSLNKHLLYELRLLIHLIVGYRCLSFQNYLIKTSPVGKYTSQSSIFALCCTMLILVNI